MKKRASCFILCMTLVLSACSGNENSINNNIENENQMNNTNEENKSSNNENEREEVEEDSETEEAFAHYGTESVEELMKQEPGIYSGDNYDEEKVIEEIMNFPEGLSTQEAFNRIQYLLAEDFREEQELFENFEVDYGELTEMPEGEEEIVEEEEVPELNVQILIDASGSMAADMDGNTKMEIAKEAVQNFASNLPEEANVSLHVYGHEGSNQTDGKEESCSRTETIYPLGQYDETNFQAALESFDATGYTPIALAIEEAGALFPDGEENVIYIVSDGEETCGGDPVAATEALQDSDVSAVVNIIGFDVEDAERQALEAIADAGEGEYFRADTADMLTETLEQESEDLSWEWLKWENTNILNALESENTQVFDLLDVENAAIFRSLDEENRMNIVLNRVYVDVDFEVNEVINLAHERARLIQEHIFDTTKAMTDEVFEAGSERMDGIGDRAREEWEEDNDNE